MRSSFFFILLCVMLTGCVGQALKDDTPAPIYYVLKPANFHHPLKVTPAIIKVNHPTIAEGLDTDRLAVLEYGRRLKYIERARWTGSLGDVVGRMIMDSLNAAPDITALSEEEYDLGSQYRLAIDISNMQAEYKQDALSGDPSVHVTIRLILSDHQRNRIVRQVERDDMIVISSNSTTEIVQAYETVLHQAISELVMALSAAQ